MFCVVFFFFIIVFVVTIIFFFILYRNNTSAVGPQTRETRPSRRTGRGARIRFICRLGKLLNEILRRTEKNRFHKLLPNFYTEGSTGTGINGRGNSVYMYIYIYLYMYAGRTVVFQKTTIYKIQSIVCTKYAFLAYCNNKNNAVPYLGFCPRGAENMYFIRNQRLQESSVSPSSQHFLKF